LTLAGHLGRLGHDIHIVLLADRIEYTLEEEYSVHIVTESGKITHQIALGLSESVHNLPRLIRRAIVDQDDLVHLTDARAHLRQAPHEIWQHLLLVITWDDDR